MKILVKAAEMPLPSSCDRGIETPAIEIDRDLRGSKIASSDGAMAGWIGCLSRGKHDFDDLGQCVDCGAERGGST